MNFFLVILFFLWLYVLTVLKRGKLEFWYFCLGSIGLFLFLLAWVQPLATQPLTKAVAAVAGIIGQLTGLFDSFYQYALLFIQSKGESISLYIDYECSGVIEIMAFSSLLWFFPVYEIYEKIIVNILGFLFIFASNVLRILLICTLVYIWGNDIYFLAHTVFGRLLFYSCSVLLYFYVFTKSQIVRQKVGSFKYDGD
ncbi:MAG: exosortase family protein XrtG [Lachnospiraceae bacterium]|nr:exosortase family protein XrtG [Lachnospiraceae bacterium]